MMVRPDIQGRGRVKVALVTAPSFRSRTRVAACHHASATASPTPKAARITNAASGAMPILPLE